MVYAWGRGEFRGQTSSPLLTIEKKTLFLERSAFFHTEISETAAMFFCAIELAY